VTPAWRDDALFADYPQSVLRRFEDFHNANRNVYAEFARYAREMRETGRKRYSAQMIVGVLRWHRDLKTRGEVFKINNDFIPLLARLLIWHHPEYASFFSLRVVRSRGVGSDEQHKRELEKSTQVDLFKGEKTWDYYSQENRKQYGE
jgi:hypothetical protein